MSVGQPFAPVGGVPDRATLAPLVRGRLGSRLEYHPWLESTNRTLYRRAEEGAPEGAVVVADGQTGGRGRLSRTWFSPPGVNLYLSVLLRPRLEPRLVALLTLAAAVAGRETFLEHGLATGIKWPNDLQAGASNRKISGVLAEVGSVGGRIDFVVLGVGFNLNVACGEFPPELAEIATSYRSETGRVIERAAFAAGFLERLERGYERICTGREGEVLEAWRAGSVTLGREVRFEADGGSSSGIARDIDPDGALRVETPAGVRRLTAGDIQILRARQGHEDP